MMGNIDQKNLIIAIALSIAIVLGFEFFYNIPRMERQRALDAERAANQPAVTSVQNPAPSAVPPGSPGAPPAMTGAGIGTASREAIIAGQSRVAVRNSHLE